MQAKVIVDNISNDGISGEWGLCIFIKNGNKNILLDFGASNLFIDNAIKMGIDISSVDYAVLSHAHYDHSGGIDKFFNANTKAKLYMRKYDPYYFKKFFIAKYIGVPQNVILNNANRIVYVEGDYKLCEGVYLIPHHTLGLEIKGKKEMMYKKTASGWKPDDFSHEQSLVFDTENGLIIFNSCSHGGAANIINEVSKVFQGKKVYGIIGGFHLYNKSKKEIKDVAQKIKETGIEYVCTGHCTKDRAYKIMKTELGDRLHQLQVGMKMDFI